MHVETGVIRYEPSGVLWPFCRIRFNTQGLHFPADAAEAKAISAGNILGHFPELSGGFQLQALGRAAKVKEAASNPRRIPTPNRKGRKKARESRMHISSAKKCDNELGGLGKVKNCLGDFIAGFLKHKPGVKWYLVIVPQRAVGEGGERAARANRQRECRASKSSGSRRASGANWARRRPSRCWLGSGAHASLHGSAPASWTGTSWRKR